MSDFRTIGVAGAGTMGSGIAIVCARAGFATVNYDLAEEPLAQARAQTEAFFDKSVQRGKLSEADAASSLANLQSTTDIEALAECEVIIEAVFEDLSVKHALMARLDAVCPEQTILASNTSTLSITEIAAGWSRPQRVVGMHFCLPAPLMKLVEMSPGLVTDDAVFQQAWDFCHALGQKPVKTKDSPGFILNYFLVPFHNDVIRMVEAGVAEPAAIDKAIKKGLGYPMGPCELLDLVGLDTQVLLCDAFYGITHDPRAACPPLLKKMVAAGHLGRKTGQGFYRYDGNAMFGA